MDKEILEYIEGLRVEFEGNERVMQLISHYAHTLEILDVMYRNEKELMGLVVAVGRYADVGVLTYEMRSCLSKWLYIQQKG